MFSEELIEQLSNFIIRPHRELYGLDKLGPKKILVKSNATNNYIEIFRQESTILSNNKKVQISFFHPEPQIPESQTTIFLHTNSGSRLEGLEYSKFLLQNGQQVCLFDYSGSGVSEGDYVSMGVNEAKDLANVATFLKEKYGVNEINLWGRSMGAVTAILYTSKYTHNVKRIVLDSPFCSFKQLVKEIVNSRTGLPEFLYGAILTRIESHIEKKLNVNLMNIDLRQEIIRLGMEKIGILFLISKDDKLVKPSHVETLYELHKGYKKIIYLEGSHSKPRPIDIREKCSDFLNSKINTVGSQKIIEINQKKQYLNLMGRMHSESSTIQEFQNKTGHQTFVPNLSQVYIAERDRERESESSGIVIGAHTGSPEFILHLGKKIRPEIVQSSAQNTPREDHSLSKYPSSKISLSQLKKGHGTIETNPNSQKYLIDFKKQSKTMAIQYKNKIKEQINRM